MQVVYDREGLPKCPDCGVSLDSMPCGDRDDFSYG